MSAKRLDTAAKLLAPLAADAARAYNESNDASVRAFLLTVINGMCRQMEHFCEPRVSQAAQEKAGKIDLKGWRWKDQKKHDRQREMFHLDHVLPVSEMRRRIIENPTVANAERVLRAAEIAWILKDEDRELTRLRFQSRRPDPKLAYKQAGIVLLDN